MRDLQSYIDEEYRKAPEEAMRLYDGKTIEEAFPHVLNAWGRFPQRNIVRCLGPCLFRDQDLVVTGRMALRFSRDYSSPTTKSSMSASPPLLPLRSDPMRSSLPMVAALTGERWSACKS